jgi:hypothetical protein
MPAIKITGGSGLRLSNVTIANADIGIEADANSSIYSKNLIFDNVAKPFSVSGAEQVYLDSTRIRNDPKTADLRRGGSFSGWRKPSGPRLPAHCMKCDLIFPSINYNIGSSLFYSRNNEETCPRCGFEHAKLSDGLFEVTKEIINILSEENISIQSAKTFNELTNKYLNDDLSISTFVDEIKTIFPRLSSKLQEIHHKYGASFANYTIIALTIASVILAWQNLIVAEDALQLARQSIEVAREQLEIDKEALAIEKEKHLLGRKNELDDQIVDPHRQQTENQDIQNSGKEIAERIQIDTNEFIERTFEILEKYHISLD